MFPPRSDGCSFSLSFSRARNTRVMTALSVSSSWAAISAIDNPITVCSISGSLYFLSSSSIALRNRSRSVRSSGVCSDSSATTTLSMSVIGGTLRSKVRANSRRRMVISQLLAAPASFRLSSAFQARMNVSWTRSLANAWSPHNQTPKRKRSSEYCRASASKRLFRSASFMTGESRFSLHHFPYLQSAPECTPGRSFRLIDLAAGATELLGLFLHTGIDRRRRVEPALAGIVAHVLGNLHRAEFRPAHRAEVRHLVRVLGHGLVVVFAGTGRVKTQVELVFPAKLEARLRQRIVAHLRPGMPLGQVGRVRRNAVGHQAFAHIVLVGQAKVFLGRHITKHGRAVPADLGGADAGGDVIVARRDVGHQRAQRVERRFVTVGQFLVHVFLDHLHGHMSRPFDHHLAI